MSLLAAKQYKPKVCETCGEEYTPTSGRQRWCDPSCRDRETDTAVAVLPAAPEAEVVARALDAELVARVDEAVVANSYGLDAVAGLGWRSAAWGFAQEIRDHPALIALTDVEASDFLDPYLEARFPAEEWHAGEEGTPNAWVRNLGDHDSNGEAMDPVEDFLRVWNLVHIKALKLALRRADEGLRYREPGAFGPELAAPRRAPFRRFLAVAYECCAIAEERTGDEVAPLATQAIADALGTERKTVAGWRQEAIRRGFIREETAPSSRGRRAGEYRWIATDLGDRGFRPNPAVPERSRRAPPSGGEEPGF